MEDMTRSQQAIDYLFNSQPSEFNDAVVDILATKLNDAIDARKQLVAQHLLTSPED